MIWVIVAIVVIFAFFVLSNELKKENVKEGLKKIKIPSLKKREKPQIDKVETETDAKNEMKKNPNVMFEEPIVMKPEKEETGIEKFSFEPKKEEPIPEFKSSTQALAETLAANEKVKKSNADSLFGKLDSLNESIDVIDELGPAVYDLSKTMLSSSSFQIDDDDDSTEESFAETFHKLPQNIQVMIVDNVLKKNDF